MTREGEKIELDITDVAFGGDGVGRKEGQAVFVPFTMIGERVEAEIVRDHGQFLRARLLRVLQSAPGRVEARCIHFGQCAGCQYQHIPYPQQCEIKTKQVRDVFERIGRFSSPPVRPILPSALEYGYRSKITLHPRDGKLCYVGWEGRPFEVKECHIAAPVIDQAIRAGGIKAVGRGDVMFRANSRGELFIHDLSSPPDDLEFVEQLGDDLEFRLPINSFFQSNIAMVPVMLETVAGRISQSGAGYLIDAYCGAGFFALYLTRKLGLKKSWGVEIDAQAIPWARKNAERLGLSNTEFFHGAVEHVLPMLLAKHRGGLADMCVLLDPPRKGCGSKVLAAFSRFRPATVIHVSCDPATLARDLRALCDLGYQLDEIQPLDMFPQTAHIECIATLRLDRGPT